MIKAYIAVLPMAESDKPLCCAERQQEVNGVANERARREKYYAWRLLEYAIKNGLGADASRLCFTKGENRKWLCDEFEFSISHSGEALAVVISDKAVGVDVERVRVRNAARMAEYMLTQGERAEYESVSESEREEWLISKWCQKEAIFKSQNKSTFSPSKIETSEFFCFLKNYELCGEKYILAVAANEYDDVNVIEVEI